MSSLDTILDRLKLHRTAGSALSATHRLMAPLRDWYILLVVFLTIVISALGLGAYLFIEVNRGGLLFTPQSSGGSQVDTIDRSVLRETLLYFEGQTTEFENLRKEAPSVQSPL